MREGFGARNPKSWQMRVYAQTSGFALTRQEPLNNVSRVALQALAAVLAGCQSLHTASYDEVYEMIAAALTKQSTRHWLALFAEHGLPAAAIREFPEVVADSQFEHRGVFADVAAPANKAETVRLIQAGYVADVDSPAVQSAAPELGEHTDEILTELGYDRAAIGNLHKSGVI